MKVRAHGMDRATGRWTGRGADRGARSEKLPLRACAQQDGGLREQAFMYNKGGGIA